MCPDLLVPLPHTTIAPAGKLERLEAEISVKDDGRAASWLAAMYACPPERKRPITASTAFATNS